MAAKMLSKLQFSAHSIMFIFPSKVQLLLLTKTHGLMWRMFPLLQHGHSQDSAEQGASLEPPLPGKLDLAALEAVDEWVEHQNQDGAEYGYSLTTDLPDGAVGLDIGGHLSALGDGNGQKVGGPRGEGLVMLCSPPDGFWD